jgi:hypothetical protein
VIEADVRAGLILPQQHQQPGPKPAAYRNRLDLYCRVRARALASHFVACFALTPEKILAKDFSTPSEARRHGLVHDRYRSVCVEPLYVMINLIPGAPYRFRRREFTPEPGQKIDLGDIVIAKPPC